MLKRIVLSLQQQFLRFISDSLAGIFRIPDNGRTVGEFFYRIRAKGEKK